MKVSILMLSSAVLLLFVFPAAASGNELNIGDVLAKLEELKGKTEYKPNYQNPESGSTFVDYQKEYTAEIRGKTVKGHGTVTTTPPASEGSSRKILILAPGSSPAKGYNVVLIPAQPEIAMPRAGDRVSFSGKAGNVSNWHGVSIDVKGTFQIISK